MTLQDTRIAEIRKRLESAFDPYELAIQDDSHLHVGHAPPIRVGPAAPAGRHVSR